ncbi:MAG: 4Fe-4S dicluster domain-containing protein [Candidatus Omnitrophica bacterium]|nr:4Fe-4S dicluster domain-containing protein [Candidatus Omnitrophota bacterium]
MHYISNDNFFKFLDKLKNTFNVFVPVKKDKQRFYKKYDTPREDIIIGEVRAFEPAKAFFSHAREIVAEGFKNTSPQMNKKPLAIVGVKACDLKGFKVQDHVFLNHDYKDPFYIRNRENNLIISADCTSAIDTCFCLAVGVTPYPEKDFDINLSSVEGGFIAETGSEKGKATIDAHANLFESVKTRAKSQKDEQRKKVTKDVERNIKENNVPRQESLKGIIEKNFESDIWKDEARACVECGACNTVCPTCHCFLLYDEKNKENLARLRIWDSCMIKDFARVAGGANPRAKLWMRLRNRFEKKFYYFPKVADFYACTGCGRCITACPAKIDIRKVLKRLVKGE